MSASYDIREDEEQQVKLQEITELLVGAGYFRARIKGLAAFDKIVGGLTWCILNCAVDIDIDLLYQENSSIGKKIALTEKIISVLPEMKCPHTIKPHQIQGLDFINIFPVVQWLVKKALETRAEREIFNRSFSLREFEKMTERKLEAKVLRRTVEKLQADQWRPQRRLQPVRPLTGLADSRRVMLTLLEYRDTSGPANTSQDEVDAAQDYSAELTAKKSKVKLDSRALSSLLERNNHEIKDATAEYEEMARKVVEKQKEDNLPAIQRKVENLEVKINNVTQRILEANTKITENTTEKKEVEENIDRKEQKILVNLEEIQKTAGGEDGQVIAKMRKLISLNEKMKKSEAEFRSNCKEELKGLQSRNGEALNTLRKLAVQDESSSESEELRRRLATERKELSKVTRVYLDLERRIDRIPSRSELSQYQRRFVELYGEMDDTQNETQNFYEMYNNLGQQKLAIEKEITLMNSIQEGFEASRQQPKLSRYEVSPPVLQSLSLNILPPVGVAALRFAGWSEGGPGQPGGEARPAGETEGGADEEEGGAGQPAAAVLRNTQQNSGTHQEEPASLRQDGADQIVNHSPPPPPQLRRAMAGPGF